MAKDCGIDGCRWAGKAHHNHDNDQYINRIEDDPSDGVKSEGHPAVNNVTNLPGMGMRRLRVFKNDMLDAVLGPEQVEPDEKMPPDVAERFDEHLDSLMAKDRTDHLNDGIADGSKDARIISMGKFKEDKANRELMGKHDE